MALRFRLRKNMICTFQRPGDESVLSLVTIEIYNSGQLLLDQPDVSPPFPVTGGAGGGRVS